MATAWTKAAELAIKFLDSDKAIDVAQTAGPLLVEVGRHSAAAQLYMGVEMIKEAIVVVLLWHQRQPLLWPPVLCPLQQPLSTHPAVTDNTAGGHRRQCWPSQNAVL